MDIWYRQVHSTSWIAYQGNRAIWEATSERELRDWLKARGLTAVHRPLRIAVVLGWEPADCL